MLVPPHRGFAVGQHRSPTGANECKMKCNSFRSKAKSLPIDQSDASDAMTVFSHYFDIGEIAENSGVASLASLRLTRKHIFSLGSRAGNRLDFST